MVGDAALASPLILSLFRQFPSGVTVLSGRLVPKSVPCTYCQINPSPLQRKNVSPGVPCKRQKTFSNSLADSDFREESAQEEGLGRCSPVSA